MWCLCHLTLARLLARWFSALLYHIRVIILNYKRCDNISAAIWQVNQVAIQLRTTEITLKEIPWKQRRRRRQWQRHAVIVLCKVTRNCLEYWLHQYSMWSKHNVDPSTWKMQTFPAWNEWQTQEFPFPNIYQTNWNYQGHLCNENWYFTTTRINRWHRWFCYFCFCLSRFNWNIIPHFRSHDHLFTFQMSIDNILWIAVEFRRAPNNFFFSLFFGRINLWAKCCVSNINNTSRQMLFIVIYCRTKCGNRILQRKTTYRMTPK